MNIGGVLIVARYRQGESSRSTVKPVTIGVHDAAGGIGMALRLRGTRQPQRCTTSAATTRTPVDFWRSFYGTREVDESWSALLISLLVVGLHQCELWVWCECERQ